MKLKWLNQVCINAFEHSKTEEGHRNSSAIDDNILVSTDQGKASIAIQCKFLRLSKN